MKIIFVVLSLGASFAFAAATTCQIQDAVRCLCAASLKVNCDNGTEGYINNTTAISSITLKTVDDVGIEKTITLQNPPGKVADYYSAKDNPWVKSQLAAQGVQFKEVYGQSFTTASAPALFADSTGHSPAGPVEAAADDGIQCNTLSEIPNSKNCRMKVHCQQTSSGVTKDLGDGEAACKLNQQRKCPSATDCAHDKTVSVDDSPRVSKTSAAPASLTQGAH